MKRTVLATSLMFSTLILGTNSLIESTTSVLAVADTQQDEINEVSNKIVFVDQRGAHVLNSSGEDYFTITGSVNGQYDLKKILPKGYEFINSNIINLKSDGVTTEVKVQALKTKNTIKFIDEQTDKEVGNWEVTELTGYSVEIPVNKIPNGYQLWNSWDKKVTISADEPNQTVKIKKRKESIDVLLRFFEGKELVETKKISGQEGEKYFINERGILPYDTELEEGQPIEVIIKKSTPQIDIKVKKSLIPVKLVFKDETGRDVLVKNINVSKVNPNIYLDGYLPKDYILSDDQKNNIDVKPNETVTIKVVRRYTNQISYVTKDGREIKTDEVSGKNGRTINVEAPGDFEIIGNKTITIKPEGGYIHKIVVDGKKISTELVFKEYRYKKVISKVKYTGKVGDEVPTKLVPKGYGMSYKQLITNDSSNDISVNKITKTTINYVDSTGKIVGKQEVTDLDGAVIKLKEPKSYLFVNNASGSIRLDQEIPVQNILVVPSNPSQLPEGPNKLMTQVNFIDRKTNKTIHSYIVEGKHGQTVDIQTPDGYELDKGSTSKLTLDKAKKSHNIYVVEKNSSSTTQTYNATVLTKKTVSLFDKNGKLISNRALGFNSSWRVNQKLTHHGETYYRVATNEYVKTQDVVEYQPVNSAIQTTVGGYKSLYDINGKKNGNRALAANTAWFTDRSANINGEKMYRVATNEWVKAIDIK